MLLPVLDGSDSVMLLEELVEVTRVYIPHSVCYFFDTHVGVNQHFFYFPEPVHRNIFPVVFSEIAFEKPSCIRR